MVLSNETGLVLDVPAAENLFTSDHEVISFDTVSVLRGPVLAGY